MAPRRDVLITSASRKVPLVQAFRSACAATGGGRVIAADVDPRAAALYEADAGVLIPRADDPGFADALASLCERESIGLVVPTRDGELPILASVAPRLAAEGTLVLVSAPDALERCLDKRAFVDAATAAGLETPRALEQPRADDFPVFVKARRGAGSRASGRADSPEALAVMLAELGDDAVVQELVAAPELTIDTFLALDGTPISCVPRERLVVVAGESVVTRTVDDPPLVDATLRLCAALGVIGHVTVQAFRLPDRILFIEVNPRYGGAATLGFAAGAPTPEFAIRLARGERVEPRLGRYEVGLTMLRSSTDRFVRDADLVGR